MCSCLSNYIGSPPNCRPECLISQDCPQNLACINQHCVDPCIGQCGQNTQCKTIKHRPICTCSPGYTGDPFSRCYLIPPPSPPPQDEPILTNPCVPSPCGPYSECRNYGGYPSCSCLPKYTGSPPNCRPECSINAECPSNKACIKEKCQDPCPGSCGIGSICNVLNHVPICQCSDGFTGDPFVSCYPKPQVPIVSDVETDPCNPSPCGTNAICNNGICTCLPEYQGDPYFGCRPECILNDDCSRDKACIRNKCINPCPGTCGYNAICEVYNHIPMCRCPEGLGGDAFTQCQPILQGKYLLLLQYIKKKLFINICLYF